MKTSRRYITVVLLSLLLVAADTPAFAMHISEGILPAPWAALWFIVEGFLCVGAYRFILTRRPELLKVFAA